MLKYSDNLIIEHYNSSKVKIIQSKGGCDFITYLEGVESDPKLKVCLQTDKFILVESENLKSIRVDNSKAILNTPDGEYILPVMRERGLLLAETPVVLPSSGPEYSWEYDFSGKNINTTFTSDMGLASSLIVLGSDLVARSINNVLEMYGDGKTAKFSITPKQFSLIYKLGKSVVKYWNSGEALFTGADGSEVAIQKTKQKLDVESLESRLNTESSLISADLSSLKIKTFGKFIIEKLILTLSNGKATFITDSARKSIECPEININDPLSLEIMSKDLKHLIGKIRINTMTVNGQTRYIIRTEDKDKVTYVMVAKTV